MRIPVSYTPDYFARLVLGELRATDPRASMLGHKPTKKAAVLGLLEREEWVPILRLSNPSASCNVMSLDVRHQGRWAPTHVRGVPKDIAGALLGPLRFLWQMEVAMAANAARTSDHEL